MPCVIVREMGAWVLGISGCLTWLCLERKSGGLFNIHISRVLKVKYFPHCDVFEAVPKSNTSFTWKRIFSATFTVKQKFRWRVRSVSDIRI